MSARSIRVLALVVALGCEAVSPRRPTCVVEVHRASREKTRVPSKVDESIFEGEALELDSLLLYALEHNPRLTAARHRLRAAEHRAFATGYLPEPRVVLGLSPAPVETRNGPIDGVLTLAEVASVGLLVQSLGVTKSVTGRAWIRRARVRRYADLPRDAA